MVIKYEHRQEKNNGTYSVLFFVLSTVMVFSQFGYLGNNEIKHLQCLAPVKHQDTLGSRGAAGIAGPHSHQGELYSASN